MATMYYLFFSILYFAVCYTVYTGNSALTSGLLAANQLKVDPIQPRTHRERIIAIASGEIGVKEETGYNDGPRVEQYLAYTGLGKGHPWCAAFVSWCYGKAGFALPRSAWSPALFPLDRRYGSQELQQGTLRTGDLFAVYNRRLGRIDHAGLIKSVGNGFMLTIEGNVNNSVVSKRRPLITVYAFANWLDRKEGK